MSEDAFAPPASVEPTAVAGAYPDTAMGAAARGWAALSEHLLSAVILGLVLAVPPTVIFGGLELIGAPENTIGRTERFVDLVVGAVFNVSLLLLFASRGEHRMTWDTALRRSFDHFGVVVWQSIVVRFLTVIGVLLLILPGVYMAVVWALLVPVIVFEGASNDARSRSSELVRPRWGQVVLLGVAGIAPFFGALVLLFVGVVALEVFAPGATDDLAFVAVTRVVLMLAYPLLALPPALMYGVYCNAVEAEGGEAPVIETLDLQ